MERFGGLYVNLRFISASRGHKERFEDITAKFAPELSNLKELAEDLRGIIFPIRGKLSTETYEYCNIVYDGRIRVFNKAIGRSVIEPQVNTYLSRRDEIYTFLFLNLAGSNTVRLWILTKENHNLG